MEKILGEFGVQPVLLAAQVVNFLILLFILKKFLYGPILNILQKRKEWVAKTLKNIEQSEITLQKANEEAEKILNKALVQSQETLDDVNKQGTLILEEVHKKAEEILNKARDEGRKIGQQEKMKIEQELRENIVDFVTKVTERTIGKVLSTKDQKELIEKAVKQLQ